MSIKNQKSLCKYCFSTTTSCDDIEAETCSNIDDNKTAVEWLIDEIGKSDRTIKNFFNSEIQKAKELENSIIAENDTKWLKRWITLADLSHKRNQQIAEMNKEIEQLKSEIPKWISVEDKLPPMGENVFAICEEFHGVQVMALCEMFDDDLKPCIVWCNAHQNLEGAAYFDDNYNVTDWMPLIKIP